MGSLSRRLGLVSILAGIAFAPSALAVQYTASSNPDLKTSNLKGTVVDSSTGEPIHGALVQVNGVRSRAMLTGADGKFDFERLPPGNFVVQPRRPGYFTPEELSPQRQRQEVIDLGPFTSPIILKLVPEGVIFGRITAENGEPLDGLQVSLLRTQFENGRKQREQVGGARTDEDGNFRIPELHPGDYYLYVGASDQMQSPPAPAPGKSPMGFPITFYPGAPDVESAAAIPVQPGSHVELNFSPPMYPLYRLSGTVSGFIPGRPVMLAIVGATGDQTVSQVQLDQQTGAFQARSVPAGQYFIEAACEGGNQLAFAGNTAINVNSDLAGIRVSLLQLVSIPIVFAFDLAKTEPGENRSGAYIRLTPTFSSPLNMNGDDGEGHGIRNLLPGSYSAEIEPQGPWYVASATYGSTDLLRDPLVVAPGSASGKINIEVRDDGATLTGTLVDGGQAAAGQVVAIPDRAPEHPRTTSTDAYGNFQFHMLAPGGYQLLAFDRLDDLEYANPLALQQFATKEKEVVLGPNGRTTAQLDLIRRGD